MFWFYALCTVLKCRPLARPNAFAQIQQPRVVGTVIDKVKSPVGCLDQSKVFKSTNHGGMDMAETKKNVENQGGMKQGQQGGAHEAPGRNPQGDRSAGGQQSGKQGSQFDPSRGGDGGSYKEGGQNEQTRR